MSKTAPKGIFAEMTQDRVVTLTIIVAALGYFVDVFDLLLFNILRVPSLKDLGVPDEKLLEEGVFLLNAQMAGLLAGGFLWGIAGDKLGRLSVLFGSIVLYSAGSIANAYITSVDQYALIRFLTGIGLAGELGVGVTLASELLPKRSRGLGTTVIASIGVLGATFAGVLVNYVTWRHAYLIGGLMGFALLLLRIGVKESGMFKRVLEQGEKVVRGNMLMFFQNWDLFRRYMAVLMIGAPLWCTVGIFITLTPEFAKDLGMADPLPTAANAVMYCYIGIALGDVLSGLMSQWLQSRRKSIFVSLVMLTVATVLYTQLGGSSPTIYYWLCFFMGLGAGYWAMFVQVGAEQFGTNLRATAATSVPNVARGVTIPVTLAFRALIPALGITGSGIAVFAGVMACAFAGLWLMKETFHDDLDYVEQRKKK
ncbi:MAG TPA: MFS transporter [Patescibacteria group bacterium]|nr:MFS transporter [Patescibacteria group bacterium]